MLDKSHAAVGCAHCQDKGATEVCTYCRALVCARCASTNSCARAQPSMRRLALGTALFDIDASGSVGLSRRGARELSAIDLETGLQTFIGVRLAAARARRLATRGTIALPRLVALPSGVVEVLASGAAGVIERSAVNGPAVRHVALARRASDPVSTLCPDDGGVTLAVLHNSGALERVDLRSESARLIAAVTPDALVAAGAELIVAAEPDATRVFDTERGDELWHLGRPAAGPARWVGLAGPHLVTIRGHRGADVGTARWIGETPPLVLEHRTRRDYDGAYELTSTITLPPHAPAPARRFARRAVADGRPLVASLGRDGRFAVALGHQLALYRLPAPTPAWVAVSDVGEGIDVTALRFAEPSRALLSADNAGRVIRWPEL